VVLPGSLPPHVSLMKRMLIYTARIPSSPPAVDCLASDGHSPQITESPENLMSFLQQSDMKKHLSTRWEFSYTTARDSGRTVRRSHKIQPNENTKLNALFSWDGPLRGPSRCLAKACLSERLVSFARSSPRRFASRRRIPGEGTWLLHKTKVC
jgi:hypothetical protein